MSNDEIKRITKMYLEQPDVRQHVAVSLLVPTVSDPHLIKDVPEETLATLRALRTQLHRVGEFHLAAIYCFNCVFDDHFPVGQNSNADRLHALLEVAQAEFEELVSEVDYDIGMMLAGECGAPESPDAAGPADKPMTAAA